MPILTLPYFPFSRAADYLECDLPSSDLGNAMKTAEIIHTNGTQAVKLPDGFHFEGDTVLIRREGEAVILEPVKAATWPPGFFDPFASTTRPSRGPNRAKIRAIHPWREPAGMPYCSIPTPVLPQ
jgi:hypothetical protein